VYCPVVSWVYAPTNPAADVEQRLFCGTNSQQCRAVPRLGNFPGDRPASGSFNLCFDWDVVPPVRIHLGRRRDEEISMIEFLSGALTLAYFVAGLHFLRFWRRTGDRLFLHFAVAFWLFTLNQIASSAPVVTDETRGWEYILRVLGFVWILFAIAEKNVFPIRKR
jgi:hypothetical protein